MKSFKEAKYIEFPSESTKSREGAEARVV